MQDRTYSDEMLEKQTMRRGSTRSLSRKVFVSTCCLMVFPANPVCAFSIGPERSNCRVLKSFTLDRRGDSSAPWGCFATPSTGNTVKKKGKRRAANTESKITSSTNEDPKRYVDDIAAKVGLKPVPRKTIIRPEKPTSVDRSRDQRRPSQQAQLDYSRNGHAVLRNYVDPAQIQTIRNELLALGRAQELKAWRQKVQVAARSDSVRESCRTIEDCRRILDALGVPSDRLPFLQYFNTWRTLKTVEELARDLAETAAILLDVPSVRLYQDSFFWKRAQDGATPWHVDARMAPFDTLAMVTLWLPLHHIAGDGSALHFVSKSHADFALPFWHPYTTDQVDNAWSRLEDRYQRNKIVHYMPLSIGDLTAHSGWTLHCADAESCNNEGAPSDRLALAISYVDAMAPIRAQVLSDADHGDDEDQWSYRDWVKEVPAGREFEHPLVPVVWPVKD